MMNTTFKAAAKAVSSLLTTPSKVAHTLDWRKASGSILSLRIVEDRLDLAVASHPTLEEPTMQLTSIPLRSSTLNNRKVLSPTVSQELFQAVKKFNVCGIVVSWPVQHDGWCGKSCGKVLHALDQIQADVNRPMCLFDPTHSTPPEDEWGRATIYSKPTKKTQHVASKEQYENTLNTDVVDVWNAFSAENWPQDCPSRPAITTTWSIMNKGSFDNFVHKDEEGSFESKLQAAF